MKLDDIRRDYLKGGLNRPDLNADPIAQFESWLQQAVDAQLSADPTAMTLATVDASGQPSQRVVLLKALDERGFVFYTNYDSHKGRDIDANAKVSLHFGWLALERQVVVYGTAKRIDEQASAAYFHSRPRASQIGAWTSQQSQPIASREDLDAAFAATEARFADQQEIPLPPFWGGIAVEPQQIEFWQGRGGRLHDRFIYRREGSQWQVERLQP
ncbi:pyridoxamine 5'-phosphate oxidase [Saccharospirillum sp. MSK14-1]|uniref:pyridoxamine 5'-phosphate oxidase n=1 Tax=Saccharospirillum sp. MSK14-1 TaxID=1897632 RepID=UPI000D33DBF7|nr:pyridoxamine 5'-phosphate oxidase [Saccharospirillum sp. MSK14-1]PTY37534.1 pyridoxamine 5'-phosphate oxidase [Saccharospirillum sp. MSK14-1]